MVPELEIICRDPNTKADAKKFLSNYVPSIDGPSYAVEAKGSPNSGEGYNSVITIAPAPGAKIVALIPPISEKQGSFAGMNIQRDVQKQLAIIFDKTMYIIYLDPIRSRASGSHLDGTPLTKSSEYLESGGGFLE